MIKKYIMEIDKLPKHYDPLPEEEYKIFENLFGVVENFQQKSNDNTISYEEKQKKKIPIASTIAIFFLLLFSQTDGFNIFLRFVTSFLNKHEYFFTGVKSILLTGIIILIDLYLEQFIQYRKGEPLSSA